MSLQNPEVLKKVDVNINSSTSKQMYSFGRNRRFRELKPSSETFFYNLPTFKSTRYASFGYGTRSDFTRSLRNGKTQVYYNIPSDFNFRVRHSPQYSMGKGREDCKRPINNVDKNDPGPGAYNVSRPLGYNALKFSIFGRDWAYKDERKNTKNFPAPGHYNQKLSINGTGRYPTSNFNNTQGLTFSGAERFKTQFNKNPGPGTYENDTIFNGTGFHFSTKYGSNVAKTMHNRPPQFYRKDKDSGTPGPGSYDFFSDFEGFQRFKSSKAFKNKFKIKQKSQKTQKDKKSEKNEKEDKKKNEKKNEKKENDNIRVEENNNEKGNENNNKKEEENNEKKENDNNKVEENNNEKGNENNNKEEEENNEKNDEGDKKENTGEEDLEFKEDIEKEEKVNDAIN